MFGGGPEILQARVDLSRSLADDRLHGWVGGEARLDAIGGAGQGFAQSRVVTGAGLAWVGIDHDVAQECSRGFGACSLFLRRMLSGSSSQEQRAAGSHAGQENDTRGNRPGSARARTVERCLCGERAGFGITEPLAFGPALLEPAQALGQFGRRGDTLSGVAGGRPGDVLGDELLADVALPARRERLPEVAGEYLIQEYAERIHVTL